jgi:hypothetical protein
MSQDGKALVDSKKTLPNFLQFFIGYGRALTEAISTLHLNRKPIVEILILTDHELFIFLPGT